MVQYLDVFYISLNINLNYFFPQIILKKEEEDFYISPVYSRDKFSRTLRSNSKGKRRN